MPCLCRCACGQVQSVTGSCLACSQCEVLLKILNLHITAATCGPVMPSASGCSNMCALSVCRWTQQTPSLECYTLAPVACCLIVLASLPMWFSFLWQHMKPRALKTTLPTCPCCALYEQHAYMLHWFCTNLCLHVLMSFCSRFENDRIWISCARVALPSI
jgi:hypothetical protein